MPSQPSLGSGLLVTPRWHTLAQRPRSTGRGRGRGRGVQRLLLLSRKEWPKRVMIRPGELALWATLCDG